MSDEDYDQGFVAGYYHGLSTDKETSFLILAARKETSFLILAARIEELKKENEKLRAAKVELLRLFDEAMEGYGDCMNYKSEYLVQKHEDQENFAELRAAAAALKETE